MNQISIVVPDGYVLDEINSTLTCVKFKKIDNLVRSWEELTNVNGYYVSDTSDIEELEGEPAVQANKNMWATREQAEACLALSQLSQLMQMYNQDKSTLKKCKNHIYCICNNVDKPRLNYPIIAKPKTPHLMTFYSYKDRERFMLLHDKLIKKAIPLL